MHASIHHNLRFLSLFSLAPLIHSSLHQSSKLPPPPPPPTLSVFVCSFLLLCLRSQSLHTLNLMKVQRDRKSWWEFRIASSLRVQRTQSMTYQSISYQLFSAETYVLCEIEAFYVSLFLQFSFLFSNCSLFFHFCMFNFRVAASQVTANYTNTQTSIFEQRSLLADPVFFFLFSSCKDHPLTMIVQSIPFCLPAVTWHCTSQLHSRVPTHHSLTSYPMHFKEKMSVWFII